MKNANENFIEVSQGLDREVEWFRFFCRFRPGSFFIPDGRFMHKKNHIIGKDKPPPACVSVFRLRSGFVIILFASRKGEAKNGKDG